MMKVELRQAEYQAEQAQDQTEDEPPDQPVPDQLVLESFYLSNDYGQDKASGYGRDKASGYGRDKASGYGRDKASGYGRDKIGGYGKGVTRSREVREGFGRDKKPKNIMESFFGGVTADEWNDSGWQLKNRLTTPDQLSRLLSLTPHQQLRYRRLLEYFHYSITPYYLSLIDWSNPEDPIRKQCIPDMRELELRVVGDNDPLEEEEDMQAPGLVHRYPDRALAVVTNMCAMYCRHCTRKRIWHEGETFRSKTELLEMAGYVRRTPEIREVIVSGGDPLTMNPELLDWFLGELSSIPHVEVLRIGTRVPVVMPMGITDELARMLARHRPLWINTQFNHPNEITPESAEAVDRLLKVGIPVSNQSVLLKGINDSVDVFKDLCHALQRIMVRPYYLYQCDPVRGVEHFRTSIWKGIEIMESMRGFTGGLCIPTFVVDAPGGGGKIPLQPFYLLSASDKYATLRNYEGMIIKYYNPVDTGSGAAATASNGGSVTASNGGTSTASNGGTSAASNGGTSTALNYGASAASGLRVLDDAGVRNPNDAGVRNPADKIRCLSYVKKTRVPEGTARAARRKHKRDTI
jgi:lysine 2,3-aminomutase